MAAALVPIGAALIFTARPVYPPDACFYGAPAASVAATDRYLALMSPLAAFAMVAVALVALPIRGRWRFLVPVVAVWAVVTLFVPDAAHPVMVYGGNVAVFGALLALSCSRSWPWSPRRPRGSARSGGSSSRWCCRCCSGSPG